MAHIQKQIQMDYTQRHPDPRPVLHLSDKIMVCAYVATRWRDIVGGGGGGEDNMVGREGGGELIFFVLQKEGRVAVIQNRCCFCRSLY